MTTREPTTQVAVQVPLRLMPELSEMATTMGMTTAVFLRMIIVMHIDRARAQREAQSQPMRRRKIRGDDAQ
jgi:hypothetical protein